MDHLLDGFDRIIAPTNFDGGGRLQQAIRQLLDRIGKGRREQQGLLVARQQGQQLANVVDEAHVEHAIGFVQHEDLDL